MQIHKMMKDVLKDHKSKIELIQWAITSSIASLIYSEYLSKIRQKQVPVRRIFLPSIRSVQEILNPDNEFMKYLSEHMIDQIKERFNTPPYSDFAIAPELALFSSDHDEVEILKTIFDLYMIPNISRNIPDTIVRKFGIGDPKQQLMVEASNIDLFDRKPPVDDNTFDYLIEETILQILSLLPTMKKDIELPESNIGIYLAESEVVMIGNDNGICPIYMNSHIIEQNGHIMDLLKFITNTSIEKMEWQENALVKNDDVVEYKMTTGAFNQVAITRFKGIELSSETETKAEE